jgi:hypothetical protein
MKRLASASIIAILACTSTALSSPAWAGSATAQYAPPAAWVDVAAIPPTPPGQAPAVQLILDDNQFNFTGAEDEFYRRRVIKVSKSEALAQAGAPRLTWNPETETVIIHQLRILRGDQVIDVLAGDKPFLVLRREANMERAMLDGRLTAAKQVEGLQVGDLLDFSWTVRRNDPIMKGKSENIDRVAHQGEAGRVRFRDLWPSDKPLRWKATAGIDQPKLSTTSGVQELLFDAVNIRQPQPPRSAPARFNTLGMIELTEFSSWAEISSLMAPLYRKAAELPPSSPIKAEAAKIKAAYSDPKARAGAALQLVEDQTRYLFLGMNDGGYVPAPADETWARRFGDCKGKTVLLLALLKELGIDAQPALANTAGNDGLDERLPRVTAFNHVLVLARIGGKSYLLDGTRTGDRRGIDSLPDFSFDWVLPVQDAGAQLRKVEQRPLSAMQSLTTTTIDATAGPDTPAPVAIIIVGRGDTGTNMQRSLNGADRQQAERSFKESYSRSQPWLTVQTMDWSYDATGGVFTLKLTGVTDMIWRRNPDVGKLEYKPAPGDLRLNTPPKREPGPNQDAPYKLAFPTYSGQKLNVLLPAHGEGYSVRGANLDQVLAGSEIHLRSWMEDGAAHFETSGRSVAPEVRVADITAASKIFQDINNDDFVIRAPN